MPTEELLGARISLDFFYMFRDMPTGEPAADHDPDRELFLRLGGGQREKLPRHLRQVRGVHCGAGAAESPAFWRSRNRDAI
jgi:hypothetical protein